MESKINTPTTFLNYTLLFVAAYFGAILQLAIFFLSNCVDLFISMNVILLIKQRL